MAFSLPDGHCAFLTAAGQQGLLCVVTFLQVQLFESMPVCMSGDVEAS